MGNRHCSTHRFQVCQIKHKLLKKQKPNFAEISKENKNFIQQKYGEYTINRKECAALADDVLLHNVDVITFNFENLVSNIIFVRFLNSYHAFAAIKSICFGREQTNDWVISHCVLSY